MIKTFMIALCYFQFFAQSLSMDLGTQLSSNIINKHFMDVGFTYEFRKFFEEGFIFRFSLNQKSGTLTDKLLYEDVLITKSTEFNNVSSIFSLDYNYSFLFARVGFGAGFNQSSLSGKVEDRFLVGRSTLEKNIGNHLLSKVYEYGIGTRFNIGNVSENTFFNKFELAVYIGKAFNSISTFDENSFEYKEEFSSTFQKIRFFDFDFVDKKHHFYKMSLSIVFVFQT